MKVAKKSKANKPHHTLRPPTAGNSVCFCGEGAWDCKGVVLDKCKQPRSYTVVTDKGTNIRRNKRHLLHTNESIEPYDNSELMDFEQDDQLEPHPQVAPSPPPHVDQPVQLE